MGKNIPRQPLPHYCFIYLGHVSPTDLGGHYDRVHQGNVWQTGREQCTSAGLNQIEAAEVLGVGAEKDVLPSLLVTYRRDLIRLNPQIKSKQLLTEKKARLGSPVTCPESHACRKARTRVRLLESNGSARPTGPPSCSGLTSNECGFKFTYVRHAVIDS